MLAGPVQRSARVKPSPAVAVVIFFAYLVVSTGLGLAAGVDAESPETLVESTGDVLRLLAATGLTAVLVAGLTTWLGWWRPVLVEPRRLPRWYIALPVIYAIAILVAIKYESLGEHGAGKVVLIGLLVLLVAFNEETVFRGLVLTALRGASSRYREIIAWAGSCLLFGALHLGLMALGESFVDSLEQAASALLAGSAYYLFRRATGTIVTAIVLHAALDFSGLTLIGDYATSGYPAILEAALFIVVLATFKIVFLRDMEPKAGAGQAAPATGRATGG